MRDKISIRVQAGRGGDGVVTFRREKYIPRGGPDGGDGGRGGHVIIVASDKTATLEAIRNKTEYKAVSGMPGRDSRKSGRKGEDLVIQVPPGSAIYDEETDELLGDLIISGEQIVAAAGGGGGRGNMHFATPQNRVPQEWEPGRECEAKDIKIIFSYPADAAVIGMPGVGKSSLVSSITRSHTKVGDYLFTTRQPYIGVCNPGLASSFKILDMPALVEGSSEGSGIGNGFLNHLKRVKLIVYMLDATRPEGMTEKAQLKILRSEVAKHNGDYANKSELIIINKIDLLEKRPSVKSLAAAGKIHFISAKEKQGVEELVTAIIGELGLGTL
ncbi:MAG: GTPase ObgE [bacterium]